jgi:DnaJ-class molecular chaperone
MLLIPDDILKLYLCALSSSQLKNEYKKIALSIHPDKNSHQKASSAFSKLNHYYNLAI